eukprot:357900-Karenia_brevis.AAC.1
MHVVCNDMVVLGNAIQAKIMPMQGATTPSHAKTEEHLRPSGADAHIFMFNARMPRRGGRHRVTHEETVDAMTMKIGGSVKVPSMDESLIIT